MPYSQLLLDDHQRTPNKTIRHLRAVWHDTRALVNEFQRPLLAIFLSIFVGGWAYGELMVVAGLDRLPYFDLPYIMLALMVLETPMDVPYEWYLVTFWYVQPVVGIYIIGRGAVDFVRLFFNRSERRNAWELAVASTYRNHIILVGVGHVGLRVARTLYQMGFDIVVVDSSINDDASEELDSLSIPMIVGDARQTSTLRDAGIAHARSAIICTSNDHINLEITMRTRDINPDVHIVTRMWDSRFAAQLKRFMNVEVLSASDLAAPAFAGEAIGIEITQTLKVGNQDFSMIRLQVQAGSFMESKTIDRLQEGEDIDIVLHGKGHENPKVHPSGETVVQAEDTLVLFARHDKITEIVARNRPKSK